jgi:DNA polymerase III alpha subunit (gram-positive type)
VGWDLPPKPWIDIYEWAKFLVPCATHGLSEVCRVSKVSAGPGQAHRAGYDARLAAELLRVLWNEMPMDVNEVIQMQEGLIRRRKARRWG